MAIVGTRYKRVLIGLLTPLVVNAGDERRQAYESRRGRNPRAARVVYGDFGLWLVLRVARHSAGSIGRDAVEAQCRSIERLAGFGQRLSHALPAP
jgi:hypothetical protein